MSLNLNKLTPGQAEILTYTRDRMLASERGFVVWAGAIRSGKTVGAALSLLIHSTTRPNGVYILGGESVRSINNNVVPVIGELCQLLKMDFKHYRAQNNPWIDIGGRKFLLFGGNDESSQDTVQGLTADGAFLDELTTMKKSFVSQVEARCSVPGALRILTFNKLHPFHWTTTDYYNRAASGDSGALLINSRIDDNPHLEASFINESRREYRGADLQRKIDNEFAVEAGQIYTNAVIETDWERPKRPPDIVSVDVGIAGTTAALAVWQVGDHVVIGDEYYWVGDIEGRLTDGEHLSNMLEQWGMPKVWVVDTRATAMKLLLHRTVAEVRPATGASVERGIRLTQRALHRGSVRLTTETPHTLAELSAYRWSNTETSQPKPIKEFDHAMDCLRNLVEFVNRLRRV